MIGRVLCWLGIHRWSRLTVVWDEQEWRDAGCPDNFSTPLGYWCDRPRCEKSKLFHG